MCWSVFASAQTKDVLVIHSYHQGFFWTDDFHKGLSEELDRDGLSYRVVYLDSKRSQNPEYLERVYQLYHTKLMHEEFAAVVVSDNNALNSDEAPSVGSRWNPSYLWWHQQLLS